MIVVPVFRAANPSVPCKSPPFDWLSDAKFLYVLKTLDVSNLEYCDSFALPLRIVCAGLASSAVMFDSSSHLLKMFCESCVLLVGAIHPVFVLPCSTLRCLNLTPSVVTVVPL